MQKADETKQRKGKTLDGTELPKPSIYYTEKFRIGIASIITAIFIFFISNTISDLYSVSNSIKEVGTVFAILAGVVPLTLIQLREVHRKDSIDRNLPLFLLALTSAVQSGANLIKSIEHAADRNMGAITPELKNLRANISWGMPIDAAMENFANRCGTRMSKRVVILLEMAIKVGGDIANNLEMIQKNTLQSSKTWKRKESLVLRHIHIQFTLHMQYSSELV